MLQRDPSKVSEFLYDEDPPPNAHIDLDKTWHAIHFLLNGTTWTGNGPLFDAILGGGVQGEEDVGYGPARCLTPDEVRATAAALNEVETSELLSKFDAQVLNDNEVYPQNWTDEVAEHQYVRENFERLVAFFQKAAKNADAMLLYIN